MSNSAEPVISVKIGGISRDVLIDSGSASNLISKDTLQELKYQGLKIELKPCKKRLYAYGGLACKQVLRMGFSEICFRMAPGRAREGEPAMVLVRFELCPLSRLTDLLSYQIEMNQSQRKRK